MSDLDLSTLDRPGTYRVKAAGATSPPFRIDTARRLFRQVYVQHRVFAGRAGFRAA
ncbi:hypothetical protein [Amycolatopsis sp. cmx-4-68]|uniref:hypothetical protein n=1 Tax=Amycolatopsis sp. cmx-4-68 TaxID=2790938 RepID=UPI00397C8C69